MFRLPVLAKDISVLPSVLGEDYVSKKVKLWYDEILTLSTIAKTHLRNAYAAFIQGILHKWNCVMHTVELVGSLFQPLEDTTHEHFIPALGWSRNYLLYHVDLVV